MTRTFHSSKLLAFLVSIFFGGFARGADDAAGIEFFEKKIRPVLVASCYECHSAAKGKHEGSLALDNREAIRKGGDSGPAFEPGKPADSLLMKALHQTGKLKMPPKKMLSPEVIADFAKWITMGAPDPRAGSTGPAKRLIDVEKGKQYWAFRPLLHSTPKSQPGTWTKTTVDRFIVDRLMEKQLAPNPMVGREKLIRRAYYDLLGLPPLPKRSILSSRMPPPMPTPN